MGEKFEHALVAIHEALQEQQQEIEVQGEKLMSQDARLAALEKIALAQAKDIARLEGSVRELRDHSIRDAVGRGVPSKVLAQAHNLSAGRVTQIAPRKPREPRH